MNIRHTLAAQLVKRAAHYADELSVVSMAGSPLIPDEDGNELPSPYDDDSGDHTVTETKADRRKALKAVLERKTKPEPDEEKEQKARVPEGRDAGMLDV